MPSVEESASQDLSNLIVNLGAISARCIKRSDTCLEGRGIGCC